MVREDGTVPYWASTRDCRACALKPRCTKGAKRIVTRNLFEAEREHVRALKGTEAFERSARERRKVEMAFAHLKRNLGFRRLRLRGITGAADEFLLAATVQNLKKLARSMAVRAPIPAECPALIQDQSRHADRPITRYSIIRRSFAAAPSAKLGRQHRLSFSTVSKSYASRERGAKFACCRDFSLPLWDLP
jgi:hypothetical protein